MKIKKVSLNIFIEPLLWLSGSLLILVLISAYFQGSNNLIDHYLSTSAEELAAREKLQTFEEVLDTYQDRTILLGVKDDAANKLPAVYRQRLAKIGGKQIKDLKFRSSYVGLIRNGKFAREDSQVNAPSRELCVFQNWSRKNTI